MSLVEVLLAAFGGTSAALGIVACIGKKFVDLQVSRSIEKYKSELEQKSSLLKTELSIYAHEQNVGISRLDQQRSDAIRSIYGRVMRWHDVLIEITKPNEPKLPAKLGDRRYLALSKALVRCAEDISESTRNNAIFFQQESYEVITLFGLAAVDISCSFYDNTFGTVDIAEKNHTETVLHLVAGERKSLLAKSKDGGFDQARQLLIKEFRLLMKAEHE